MIVVAVEYLNTLPFIYGIRTELSNFSQCELSLAIPSKCAELAFEGNCDVVLVPVGALKQLLKLQPQAQVITNYCLSANRKVRTVELLSNSPLEDIKTIYLDSHSRTSVQLVRLLCERHWLITPEFRDGIPSHTLLQDGEAMLAIGDKVFGLEDKFAYNYDLATAWAELYDLPFVFAVWVALTDEGREAEATLNRSIEYGLSHIEDALVADDPLRPSKLHYLTELMQYEMSEGKERAMQLFLNYI